MTHKYKIRYRIVVETREEDFVPEDASDEQGLTDGLVAVSLLYPEDGSYSQQIVLAADGRTNEAMQPNDIFKLWMTMGLGLADSDDFIGGKDAILKAFAGMIRQIFNGD